MTNYRTNLARNDNGNIFEMQFYFDNEQEAQEFLAGSLNGLTESGVEVTDLTLEHKTDSGWELTDFSIHDAEELAKELNSQEYLTQEGCGEMFRPIDDIFAAEIEEEQSLELYRADTWLLSPNAGDSHFFKSEEEARDYLADFADGGFEENAKTNGFALYDPDENQISFDDFDINNYGELYDAISKNYNSLNANDLEPEEFYQLSDELSEQFKFNPDFLTELNDDRCDRTDDQGY